MKLIAYYLKSERRFAGLFAIASAAYFLTIAATGVLVILSSRELLEVPKPVWHFLLWFVDGWTKVMGAFAAVVLASPIWFLWRGGPAPAKFSAGAAFKTVGVVFSVFCVTFVIFLEIMMSLQDEVTASEPAAEKVRCYASFADFKGSAWASFMVPGTAVDIKMIEESGFGYRHCGISCTVCREDLDRFAGSHGYHFERRDWLPVLAEDVVVDALYPLDEDLSRYLYCCAREGEKEIPGWGLEGHLSFVYDIKAERLYASYYD